MIRKEGVYFESTERYSSEPKNREKFIVRISNKLVPYTKNHANKTEDCKHITIDSFGEDMIVENHQKERTSTVVTDLKRKSFVVSRRKKYKYLSTLPPKRNVWISGIEYESYQGLREYNEDRVLIK
jgi:hypothetical protein